MTPRYHRDGEIAPATWVFVFGSNLAGRHGAGAAKVARICFGAMPGEGSGRMGSSYAIPTKDADLRPLPLNQIAVHVMSFLLYAEAHKAERFWLTRIGCGLAGYQDHQIAPFFYGAPLNVSYPEPWRPYT